MSRQGMPVGRKGPGRKHLTGWVDGHNLAVQSGIQNFQGGG